MPRERSEFRTILARILVAATHNSYGAENWDADRFGPYQPPARDFAGADPDQLVSPIAHAIDDLAWLYEVLGDDASRSLLVEVLAYRLMGPHNVKLRVNTPEYWPRRNALQSLVRGSETVDINFLGMKLSRMSLEDIGYPIELYFNLLGAMNTFVLKQYEYSRRRPAIGARAGDHVIDGGGCYGDTALFFANAIGEKGRVASFEFPPANVETHRQNLNLNPALCQRVDVVSRALWDRSGDVFYYRPFGPATHVVEARIEPAADALPVTTMSIDDFVRDSKWPRVDFIKMDIEGAELRALQGAENTLRSFVPALAISVYHRDSDFVDIPRYLTQLGLDYELFLDHCTIYGEETVLFAVRR
jgi:FkbM family methyltransferase